MPTHRILTRAAVTAALASAAALGSAPAFAATLPDKPGPISYGTLQSDQSDQSDQSGAHPTKAQVEHGEGEAATATTSGLPLQVKARVEQLERQTADQQPAVQPGRHARSDPSGSSGSDVPGVAIALVAAALAAGAGGVVVYRFRHHTTDGPDARVGAATA